MGAAVSLHPLNVMSNLFSIPTMRRFGLILAVCCMFVTAMGCSARKPVSSEDYYALAQLDFANGSYDEAINNYQILIDRYPFSPYAQDAEMKVGMAHYKMGQYAQAIASLTDFQRMHPTSPNLQLVAYYIAMSYYDQIGRADQDQTATIKALGYFDSLEQQFPESPFAELAREKAASCRGMLARHEQYIGNYYFKRANFRAAESRYAELLEKYPNAPVAPVALWDLGVALEKEGKKYSAAQAFAAIMTHYPDTEYGPRAKAELKKLNQPVENEEDPLSLVLAENGYGQGASGVNNQQITVRQADSGSPSGMNDPVYGSNGLPDLSRALQQGSKAAPPASAATPSDPAVLKTVRLASANSPLSVIFDLTRPVEYEKQMKSGQGYTTVTLLLKGAKPTPGMNRHLVFDRSIFKECEISTDSQGTLVTLKMAPVANCAVVPLENPARLLVTFTPERSASSEADSSGPGS